MMDSALKETVIHRLRSVAGHVKSLERMVEEDVYCIDIIQQIEAVEAALSKVSVLLLDNHLRTCVINAVQGDDPSARETALNEISALYAHQSGRK